MASTLYIPSGAPTFLHLHVKPPYLPTILQANVDYPIQFSATDEMDMYIPNHHGTSEASGKLAIKGEVLLSPHSYTQSNTTTTQLPEFSALSSLLSFLPRPAFNILGKNGKANFHFQVQLSPSWVSMTSKYPNLFNNLEFYLYFAIPSHSNIVPAISGPHRISPSPPSASPLCDQFQHAFFVPTALQSSTSNANSQARTATRVLPPNAIVPASPVSPSSLVSVSASSVPRPFIVIREICGVHLGGRVWDCALYLREYMLTHCLNSEAGINQFRGKKLLELGSGTGVFGLWLAKFLQNVGTIGNHGQLKESESEPEQPITELLLSDQPEAMELLAENIERNQIFAKKAEKKIDQSETKQANEQEQANEPVEPQPQPTAADPSPSPQSSVYPVNTQCSTLSFGDADNAANLVLQPPFDWVIGSDVIFNPRYFDALLDTLKAVCTPGTKILFAYRPRSVEEQQDRPFFAGAKRLGIHFKPQAKYNNVFILLAETKDKPIE